MKKKPRKRAPEMISRAELARRRGVARSSATRACASRLKAAVAGDLVDANHPAVRKWLREGDTAPKPKAQKPAAGVSTSATPTAADFTALTYRIRKAQVEERESRLERMAGKLISAELVRQKVFGPIEGLFHRLLTDFVSTAASTTLAAAHSGASLIDVKASLRGHLSSELQRAQRSMQIGLRQCKTGDNPPEVQSESSSEQRAADQQYAAMAALTRRLASELRTNATPELVAVVVKAFARAAGGRLDEALALLPRVEQEVSQQVAAMLEGHVQRFLSRMARNEENQDDPR